jgi:hypothetical protein
MKNYGMAKEHNPISQEIYYFISDLDFKNGDFFIFKSGGDGDNGEFLMDLLDCYFEYKREILNITDGTERPYDHIWDMYYDEFEDA